MTCRYLEFRLDKYLGMSNVRMGLEIGVGLAHLARRTLVPYDVKPLWRGSHPVVDQQRKSREASILDLFEVPVPTLPEAQRPEIATLSAVELDWPDLYDAVFRHPAMDAVDERELEAFCNRRERIVTFSEQDEASPVLRFSNRGLSLYSYFFYLPADLRAEMRRIIAGVRPREPYRQLAHDLCTSIGSFNAVHIRRGNFLTNWYYEDLLISPQTVVANLSTVMPRDEPLVICTDASRDIEFFQPILEAYREAILLDQYVLGQPIWRERLHSLPSSGDAALALVSQIVASEARVFAGSLFSTFTAMIHRAHGLRTGDDRFLFAFNPLDGVPFHDCAFVDLREGAFSWNRFPCTFSSDTYAWFREWPEALRDSMPA
jgi:hypothetical protein